MRRRATKCDLKWGWETVSLRRSLEKFPVQSTVRDAKMDWRRPGVRVKNPQQGRERVCWARNLVSLGALALQGNPKDHLAIFNEIRNGTFDNRDAVKTRGIG